jgi:formylglycine-generating enzyme required for sulfatase activity
LSSSFRFTVSLLRRSRFIGFRIAANLLNPSNLSNLVTITDINNNNDTTGYGGVTYAYQISKFPITNFEYTEFLNNIASTDTYGLYNTAMNSTRFGGITRSGVSGSYTYATKTNMENSPVVFINWFDAARYCNWLHNNKPTGNQNNNTTESGAYTLNGAISGNSIPKDISAIYWIPTENEWYKAAYYKGGGTNAGYWTYATQSDSEPTFVVRNALGNGLISSISVSPKIKQSKIR